MTLVKYAIAFTCFSAAILGQKVSVDEGDWIQKGVMLTPYSSASFATKLGATSSVVDTTSLQPFSFFITNNTGHKIVAYATLWTSTDPSGKTTTHHSTIGSLDAPDGPSAIPIGADRLVLTEHVPKSSNLQTTFQNDMERRRGMLAKQASVTITLEAIVRDDGLALGNDRHNAIAQFRAQLDTRTALAADILAASKSGGDQAVINLLKSAADATPGDVFQAASQSTPDKAYAAFRDIERQSLASAYLPLATRSSEAMLRVASNLAAQQHLTIHR
jgi:hypothetical protein